MTEMLTSEARFIFISIKRDKGGYSCCNMVMLTFFSLLYETSFCDQNQSKLWSIRVCYLLYVEILQPAASTAVWADEVAELCSLYICI